MFGVLGKPDGLTGNADGTVFLASAGGVFLASVGGVFLASVGGVLGEVVLLLESSLVLGGSVFLFLEEACYILTF